MMVDPKGLKEFFDARDGRIVFEADEGPISLVTDTLVKYGPCEMYDYGTGEEDLTKWTPEDGRFDVRYLVPNSLFLKMRDRIRDLEQMLESNSNLETK